MGWMLVHRPIKYLAVGVLGGFVGSVVVEVFFGFDVHRREQKANGEPRGRAERSFVDTTKPF